ncbi:MAG: NADH-quinone oxidoreductase subunit J [Deltaproteobacteria bacterium]|nr:NADH-quinone oxidoreductase subunit J [Deltaproteobacteria bacterium]
MTRVRVILAALLALGLTVLCVAPALAADGDGDRAGVNGDAIAPAAANGELPAISGDSPAPQKPGTRDLIIFWTVGGLAILGALAVITRKNPVTAVMCLVGTFLALAVVYIMLLAHFLAVIQVLVYAGAIMVLFVFVVMIINREESDAWELSWKTWIGRGVGVAAGVFLAVRFITILARSTRVLGLSDAGWSREEMQHFGTTRAVGELLFTRYLVPFEAVSLLLLIAVIGALVLARPHEKVGDAADAAGSPAGQAKPDKGGAH